MITNLSIHLQEASSTLNTRPSSIDTTVNNEEMTLPSALLDDNANPLDEFPLFGKFPIEIREMIWELALVGIEPENVYLQWAAAFTHSRRYGRYGQYLRVRSDVAIGTEPPDDRQMRTVIISFEEMQLFTDFRTAYTPRLIANHMTQRHPENRSHPYPYTQGMQFHDFEPGSVGFVCGEVEKVLHPGIYYLSDEAVRTYVYSIRVLGDRDWVQFEYEDLDTVLQTRYRYVGGWKRTHSLPDALTACREAFNVASRSWLSFSSVGTIGENYFNPKRDCLVLDGITWPDFSLLLREDRERVQKLAFRHLELNDPDSRYFGAILASFGNVKQVVFYVWDQKQVPYNYKGEVEIKFHDPVSEKGWSVEATESIISKFRRGLQAFWQVYHGGGTERFYDLNKRYGDMKSSWPMPEVIKFMIATHNKGVD